VDGVASPCLRNFSELLHLLVEIDPLQYYSLFTYQLYLEGVIDKWGRRHVCGTPNKSHTKRPVESVAYWRTGVIDRGPFYPWSSQHWKSHQKCLWSPRRFIHEYSICCGPFSSLNCRHSVTKSLLDFISLVHLYISYHRRFKFNFFNF